MPQKHQELEGGRGWGGVTKGHQHPKIAPYRETAYPTSTVLPPANLAEPGEPTLSENCLSQVSMDSPPQPFPRFATRSPDIQPQQQEEGTWSGWPSQLSQPHMAPERPLPWWGWHLCPNRWETLTFVRSCLPLLYPSMPDFLSMFPGGKKKRSCVQINEAFLGVKCLKSSYF